MALVKLDNISMAYGRRVLFRGVSAEVEPGDALVVTGSNGSGKSTLLRIVAGLARPDSGAVQCPEQFGSIGFAAPDAQLYGELTADENLEFARRLRGLPHEATEGLLPKVGLRKSRGGDLVGSFSSGMRQRLKLATSLLGEPAVLIWDEPTMALDAAGIALVDSLLQEHRERGGASILATNDSAEASRWADLRLHVGQ